MLDGLSLDQLRTFVAAAKEGSFSAAARKLLRSQSIVSDTVAALEAQMGVQLFDRSGRYPKLTEAGQTLLADAQGIIASVDFMKARAKSMSAGTEPQLSVVVDVLFPISIIAEVAKEFHERFPGTPLQILVEALGATHQRVLSGHALIGIATQLPIAESEISREHVSGVPLVMVASPQHALAAFKGNIPKEELKKHVQLVLTDRSSLSEGVEFAVVSSSIWRLTDLFAKHAFLLNGLGWGGMPMHIVQDDIAQKRLVQLHIEGDQPGGVVVPMSAIYQTKQPPGPAGRWFIDRARALAETHTASLGNAHLKALNTISPQSTG